MLLDEIGTYLTNQGVVGGATGWTLAKAYMPPSPDQVVALFETGGFAPELPVDLDRPTFQVRVRGTKMDYPGARAKIDQVVTELHKFQGTLSGVYYVMIAAMQSPMPLGYDENERPELAVNFRALRSR